MADMTRFRVRTAGQTWHGKGPDMLRNRGSARGTLRALMGQRLEGWYVQRRADADRTDWVGPLEKVDALGAFDGWQGTTFPVFVVGRVRDGKVEERFFVKREDVRIMPLDNCSPETIALHSLVHHQFPKVVHSGDYLYRQIKDSDWWSDHAYGTAIDESPRDGMANDVLFDWEVRMFRSGNASSPDGYVIGSLKGRVMEASAPDWTISPSTASKSHTWHVHTSLRDHDGRKPVRQGGVW